MTCKLRVQLDIPIRALMVIYYCTKIQESVLVTSQSWAKERYLQCQLVVLKQLSQELKQLVEIYHPTENNLSTSQR